MNKIKDNYIANPCKTLSIPYWKAKAIALPDNMKIVHDDHFGNGYLESDVDDKYFRLKHDLKSIAAVEVDGYYVRVAEDGDIDTIVSVINRSYDDLQVSTSQISGYRESSVFMPSLWILIIESSTVECIGCGIADYDSEVREGILEWIQVLPAYRGRGIGKLIVCELLGRLKDIADFVTVSGKVNNITKPEALYRSCGFTGNDIWHVFHEKA